MRLVLESQLEDGSRGGGGSGGGGGGGGVVWEGRLGTELKSDIWTGSVIDWGRRDAKAAPWAVAPPLPAATVALDVPAAIRPLQAPPSRAQEAVFPVAVQAFRAMADDGWFGGGEEAAAGGEGGAGATPTSTFVYSFPTMVTGTAVVSAGSFAGGAGGGNISVQYCELLTNFSAGAGAGAGGGGRGGGGGGGGAGGGEEPIGCAVFTSQYPSTGTRDEHILPADGAAGADGAEGAEGREGGGGGASSLHDTALAAQHTWTGFQHLIVRTTGASMPLLLDLDRYYNSV
jgi:hypothetical protein